MIKSEKGVCEIKGSIPEIIQDMLCMNIGYRQFLRRRGWTDEQINQHMVKYLYAAADLDSEGFFETTPGEEEDK